MVCKVFNFMVKVKLIFLHPTYLQNYFHAKISTTTGQEYSRTYLHILHYAQNVQRKKLPSRTLNTSINQLLTYTIFLFVFNAVAKRLNCIQPFLSFEEQISQREFPTVHALWLFLQSKGEGIFSIHPSVCPIR